MKAVQCDAKQIPTRVHGERGRNSATPVEPWIKPDRSHPAQDAIVGKREASAWALFRRTVLHLGPTTLVAVVR